MTLEMEDALVDNINLNVIGFVPIEELLVMVSHTAEILLLFLPLSSSSI